MKSPIIGIAYARMSAPDLDMMQEWLEDFGFILVERTDKHIYMRGTGDEPFIHVTELGPEGTVAFGYNARDENVLHDFVRQGAAEQVEDIDEPGGGKRVILTDPNGFEIEIVHGRKKVEPLPPLRKVRGPTSPSNRCEPSRVKKMSHGVLATPLLNETIDWFQKTLGLIHTDEIYIGEPDNRLGMFSRMNQGKDLVDHHIVFVVKNKNKAGSHHTSWEVDDVDEIFCGNQYLQRSGKYEHIRGIGRHALGCQIFDYWMSPFEQMHEHWKGMEFMDEDSGFNQHRVDSNMGHDHGEKPTPRFSQHASAFQPRLKD